MSRDRKTYIGGSDIGTIIGCDGAFLSPLDLWELKTGNAEPKQPTLVMNLGTMAENLILDEYAIITGKEFDRQVSLEDPDVPHFAGIADGMGDLFGVDAKFTSKYPFDSSEDLPATWQAQGQWYLMLSGAVSWDFAVLHSAKPYDIKVYTILRDDDVIEYLRDAAERFWLDVQMGVPPEPSNPSEVARYFKYVQKVPKQAVVATDEMLDLLAAVKQSRSVASEAEEEGRRYQAKLQLLMDNAAYLVDHEGNRLARWNVNKKGVGSLTLL